MKNPLFFKKIHNFPILWVFSRNMRMEPSPIIQPSQHNSHLKVDVRDVCRDIVRGEVDREGSHAT